MPDSRPGVGLEINVGNPGLKFQSHSVEDINLLGAPLSLTGSDKPLKHSHLLVRASKRLLKLTTHEAFFLLKNSLAIPRIQDLLRTSPCFQSPETSFFDEEVIAS